MSLGRISSLKILCESSKIDLNFPNVKGITPFLLAASSGNIAALKMIKENGANINCKSNADEDALYMAAKNSHLECVQYLISLGLPLNYVSKVTGCTPIGIAAYSGHLNVVKLLKYKGASLIESDIATESTPLLLSCQAGHIDIVEFLLESEEVCSYKPQYAHSPLVHSIGSKSEKLVSILLKNKLDIDVKNEKGENLSLIHI